jgi:hypothetical protein
MAQYKVPQDVEAEDKLLGPFTFRQFIYLIIVSGLIAIAWLFFQIFPFLVIIPLPLIIFFGALALPLKKDQPMETYLAAIVSFYLKSQRRLWRPGVPESTIEITAPKIVEPSRVKDISGNEATHRLSFLANLIDSEGYAIMHSSNTPMREEFYAEAMSVDDMLDTPTTSNIDYLMQRESNARHDELVNQMKAIINNAHATAAAAPPTIQKHAAHAPPPPPPSVVVNPSPALVDLANTEDLSVATIAKEANRLTKEQDDEVFISLR